LQLPDFPQLPAEFPHIIADRHGLRVEGLSRLNNVGIFNAIYVLGSKYVLRVPRDAPPFVAAIRKESIAVPVARAAGVRTPALVAFDDSLDLLPVPYAIYERVHGDTLGLLDLSPQDTPEVWSEVGRDLAKLHEGVSEDGPANGLEPEPLPDPQPMPDELASAGHFTSGEAHWLSGWLDLLAPFALAPVSRRFRHGDSQTTNIMVRPGSTEYLVLIDWGACSWGIRPTTSQAYRLELSRSCSPDTGRSPSFPKMRRRRLAYCGGICRSPCIFQGARRSQDYRGPNVQRQCS
jgi:aminoglycoside phosphotransferase (APT) family kinase protein